VYGNESMAMDSNPDAVREAHRRQFERGRATDAQQLGAGEPGETLKTSKAERAALIEGLDAIIPGYEWLVRLHDLEDPRPNFLPSPDSPNHEKGEQ
jgi:hypothetical protein